MQQYFKFYYQPGLENLGDYPSKHHTADIHQHGQPYYVHMDNSPTLLPQAMKPSTCRGCAEILGDPYSKKSPLPSMDHNLRRPMHVLPPGHYPGIRHLMHVSPLLSMGTSPCLAISPTDTSYRVLGQSRIQQRNTTRYNHPRIHAQ
jgi:hypothetical protein